jgi:superfamily I DNA/RNA helicase
MLTRQQRAIVNLAKSPDDIPAGWGDVNGELIRVTAAAGTGKTTTMEAVTERLLELGHPMVMYVTFTREQKKDAEARFAKALGEKYPGRVHVKTLHGLAGELLGVKMVDRINEGNLERLTLQLFRDDIDEFLLQGGVNNAKFKVRRQRAFWIAKTMMSFLQNKTPEDDAAAFKMYYPARLYYEGEKRLDKNTPEAAAKFFRVRAR